MFYYNNDVISETLLALVHTGDSKLANFVFNVFDKIDVKSINDQLVANNVTAMRDFSKHIKETDRKMDFRELMIVAGGLEFNDIIKMTLIGEYKPSKGRIDELIKIYAILKELPYIDPYLEKIYEATNILRSGSLSQIIPAYNSLRGSVSKLATSLEKIEIEKGESKFTLFDTGLNKTYGITDLYESMMMRIQNKVMTGHPAFDNLTQGFSPRNLYAICALPGHFKSGLMMNIGEYVSINHKVPELLEGNLKPCIYEQHCELTPEQIYIRRLGFYGRTLTQDELENMTPEMLNKIFNETLTAGGSKIPIVTSNRAGKAPSTLDMANDFRELISLGYRPILVIDDYMDLHTAVKNIGKSTSTSADAANDLTEKARDLKNFAKEFNVPVFTGAQINREGERFLSPAFNNPKVIDPAYYLNASFLAKGHALNQVLDMNLMGVFIGIDEPINDGGAMQRNYFYSLVAAKDREGVAKYKLSERDIENQASYDAYTRRMKNTPIGQDIKMDGRYHVVMPVHNYRLSLDYAKSIRMFYSNENSVFSDFSNSFHSDNNKSAMDLLNELEEVSIDTSVNTVTIKSDEDNIMVA